ncbi:MAG TPA: amino acid adenylation domain-containing protein, partial [Verrucomicrobiae bacterium]|nr:amino acid adenylation domain-containing protein [Verrucomicrobiae bacterium]
MTLEDEITTPRAEFSAEKKALLERRLRGAGKDAGRPAISRRAQRGSAPLSFAQQRLWFLDQLEPGSPLYNMALAMRMRGRLDGKALQKALQAVISRHEVLRTRFEAEDGNPVQIIAGFEPAELPLINLSGCPGSQREDELQRTLQAEARRVFDLSRGPLLRATLLRLGETEHVLLIVVHHIVSDAWSLGILFRELGAFYEAFSLGRNFSPPELPIEYADFAVWQRGQLSGETMEKQLAFWKRHLAGAPHFLELPTDQPRPPVQSFRGACAERLLPKPLAEKLKWLARAEGATFFMTLLAAFKILLHRYARQSHLVVGTPIAGRTHSETEGLVGFFVNTLALHTDVSGNPSFRELLGRVRQTTLDGYAHQDLPFERLVAELQPIRSPEYTPFVQVMFTLQNNAARELKIPWLVIEPVKIDTGTAKFDWMVAVEEWPHGLLVEVEYNTDLFMAETVTRMLGHFQTLLEGIAADPAKKISELPLLDETEQNQILAGWNAARTNYPRDKTISQLFEEQVEKTPGAVALVVDGRQLTYLQLNERANQLAHRLQKLGVGTGAMVGICLERSLELIVALLGILKAGAAYVSLDPSYPRERLKLMLDDVRPPVLLTLEKFRDNFLLETTNQQNGIRNLVLVCLDKDREPSPPQALANPASGADAASPAYVSFTSGSTGRPKGVVVPHRGVTRLVRETNYAQFGADEVFLHLAPVAFDASTFEIWGALLNGAKLVVFPPQTPSLAELGGFIRENNVTALWLTAGLFHQMVEEQLESLRGVRQLLAGGDVLSVPHVKRALENLPGCKIINGYGPTENTTFTCCHHITAADCAGRSIPIGRPIANTQVYVLGEDLQPGPIGVPGELCIGGDGLALGYLNQPELTAEKFVPNPFDKNSSSRLYKTGDLVRWLPEGVIEFLGRVDRQVKIRGFRVEPGEIETVLNEHPAVRECAVSAWGESADGKQLAAYFVADQTAPPSPEGLRAYLRSRLPDYMIPGVFVPLESLPLNGNGKVDRRALPLPDRQITALAKTFVAPRDKLEAQLAKIWEEVLEVPRVGAEDHFFNLGGHSLLAVRLLARIEKVLDRKIPVAAIFQSPTVAQLANVLREKTSQPPASSLVGIQPQGSKPPLFLVHGVGGGMFWGYTNLSKYLGSEQPLFAFKSRGMDGLEEFGTIEEMAAQYVADLRAFQPHGPYRLGGYCFGGNVAYEMARLLREQGETISLLALINCAPPNSSYARFHF